MGRRTAMGLILVLALISAGCPGGSRAPLEPGRLTSGRGDKFAPDFSPDGKEVVFVKRTSDNETHLFAVSIGTRQERRLTFVPSVNGEPAWSHDGTRVAFESNREGGMNVFVVAADTGEMKGCPRAISLTTGTSRSGAPAWSPDDARIAFESDRSGNFDICAMDADGDNVVVLTTGPTDDTTPAWSPDGKLIAFASGRAAGRDVWMINPDGSLPRRLTTESAEEWRPRWTPDSRQLIFMWSETPGDVEFHQVLHTGSGAKQVLASSEPIRDPVVSPDGKWLAFSAKREGTFDIYLLKLGP